MNKEELRKEAYLFAKNNKDVQNFECGFDIAFKSYLAAAEPREKHIKELERSCNETQELLDKQIEVTCKLDQENAELRKEWQEQVQKANDEGCARTLQTMQLTKAKEIIKNFSEFVNNKVEYDPEHPQEHTNLWNELCEQAEQFLKENK